MLEFIDTYKSPNFDPRPAGMKPDMIILHYTGMKNGGEALERLISPPAKVSAHYLIEENGDIYHLVDEAHRAWHAGVSFWDGQTGLNDCAIGIEIVNPGHEWGYRPFPKLQMMAVLKLAGYLKKKFAIADKRILGHSDVAPERKQDPGELFDWRYLAQNGVGLWPVIDVNDDQPSSHLADEARFKKKLGQLGMNVTDIFAATVAFQRHWRPWNVSGEPDVETFAILDNLLLLSDA